MLQVIIIIIIINYYCVIFIGPSNSGQLLPTILRREMRNLIERH